MPLPPLLRDLLRSGAWCQPADNRIQQTVPFLKEPVDFLLTEERMRFESSGFLADDPRSSEWFHEFRGSVVGADRALPWLDVDKALFIAVNREIGADLGIALDYRTDISDPRVVASEWSEWNTKRQPGSGCHWLVAAPTFSAFVKMIGL
ncbi:MAG TPA: hypothetical protein VEK08_16785 [Planctomycetota bacterium]|nr:hypothetical protein [Planctomycetota bacterium]